MRALIQILKVLIPALILLLFHEKAATSVQTPVLSATLCSTLTFSSLWFVAVESHDLGAPGVQIFIAVNENTANSNACRNFSTMTLLSHN